MATTKDKLEVAFSLVSKDEIFASNINYLLRERVKTFLYVHNESETINADGMETFANALKQARIVVLIFREKYGNTPWTRVEKDVIEQRFLDEGRDFLFVIVLADESKLPKWIPKFWIYARGDSPELMAQYIEYRIRDNGGTIKPETSTDLIKRLNRDEKFKLDKERYLGSPKASEAAIKEVDEIINHYENKKDDLLSFGIREDTKKENQYRRVITYTWKNIFYFVIKWEGNPHSTQRQVLHIYICGVQEMKDSFKKFYEKKFKFDMLPTNRFGWALQGNFYDSLTLAEDMIKKFIKVIEKEKNNIY